MRRTVLSVLPVLLFPVYALAQTGVPPFGSFTPHRFDLVNNANANVVFAIPIVSSPGRGLNLDFSLVYNSQVWTPVFNQTSGTTAWTAGGWLVGSYNNPLNGTTTSQFSSTTGSCRVGTIQSYTLQSHYNNFVYTDMLGTRHPLPLSVTSTYNDCRRDHHLLRDFFWLCHRH